MRNVPAGCGSEGPVPDGIARAQLVDQLGETLLRPLAAEADRLAAGQFRVFAGIARRKRFLEGSFRSSHHHSQNRPQWALQQDRGDHRVFFVQRAECFHLGVSRVLPAVGDIGQVIGEPDDRAPIGRAAGLPKLDGRLVDRFVEVGRLFRRHGSGACDGARGSGAIRGEPIDQAGVAGIDHHRDFIGGLEVFERGLGPFRQAFQLSADAVGEVEQQNHRQRELVAREMEDLLRNAFLGNLEIAGLECGRRGPGLALQNLDVHQHQLRRRTKNRGLVLRVQRYRRQ